MENYIIFNQTVFKLSLGKQQMFAIGIIHPITPPEIMAFCNVTIGYFQPTPTRNLRTNKIKQGFDFNI